MKSPIILALDTSDLDIARKWIETTYEFISIYKVGLEFYLKFGLQGIKDLQSAADFSLFLDLKLHDIPNTVAGAAAGVSDLTPKFLTVHASGGSEMINAAVKTLPNVSITAVTVLTSLDETSLSEIGFANGPMQTTIALSKLAVAAGARSIVCSPVEVEGIRAILPSEIELITPGVRPHGSDIGDQSRIMTPKEAMKAGANYLVIGRPITGQWKVSLEAMRDATKAILDSI